MPEAPSFQHLPGDPTDFAMAQIDQLRNGDGTERALELGHEMKKEMFDNVGVFRTEEGLKRPIAKIQELRQRFYHVHVADQGKIFNTELIECLGAWAICSTWRW